MIKLFGEIIQNKKLAIWIVIATLFLCCISATYKIDDSIVERYSIGKSDTIENINKEIEQANCELEALLDDENPNNALIDNIGQKIIVLEELLRTNAQIDYSIVYQGPGTAKEDRHAFVFETLDYLVVVSLISSIMIIWIVFTREFDEGVFVHIYNKNRTKNIMTRSIVTLITSTFLFFCGVAILYVFSSLLPSVFKLGLLVDSSKAYFIDIGSYTIIYGVLRSYYIVEFITMLFLSVAMLTKKTLTMVISSSALSFLILFLYYNKNKVLSFFGIGNLETMVYTTKLNFDLSAILIIIPVAIIIATSIFFFEKQDLN